MSHASLFEIVRIYVSMVVHTVRCFLEGKKRGKKEKETERSIAETNFYGILRARREGGGEKFPSAPFLLRLRIALTDWTERERGNFIRLRNDRDVTPPPTAPRLQRFPPFLFYLLPGNRGQVYANA